MKSEELLWSIEGFLSTAFEAVEELDALVRRELGGDPSPIGEVQSGFARQALSAIREAGEQLRPASRSAEDWARRAPRLGELLSTATDAVERLDAQLRRLRGEYPVSVWMAETEPGRRAFRALCRANGKFRILGAMLGARVED